MASDDLQKSAIELARKKRREEYQKMKNERLSKKEEERLLRQQQKHLELEKLIKKASDLEKATGD